jgi:phosphoadenosine phosphosulfate reductase
MYKFIKRYYPDVTWLFPEITFWEGIRRKSPPLRMMRWCCDVLKKNPSKHIPLKHRLMGIRAEESFARASRPRIYFRSKNNIQYKPIFYWKEWNVWEFIDGLNLPSPSLYKEGFDRIGCVVCPFIMSKYQGNLNIHKNRWPGIYKVFEKVVKDWFLHHSIKKSRYSEQSAEEYLAAYYRGFERKSSCNIAVI